MVIRQGIWWLLYERYSGYHKGHIVVIILGILCVIMRGIQWLSYGIYSDHHTMNMWLSYEGYVAVMRRIYLVIIQEICGDYTGICSDSHARNKLLQ